MEARRGGKHRAEVMGKGVLDDSGDGRVDVDGGRGKCCAVEGDGWIVGGKGCAEFAQVPA